MEWKLCHFCYLNDAIIQFITHKYHPSRNSLGFCMPLAAGIKVFRSLNWAGGVSCQNLYVPRFARFIERAVSTAKTYTFHVFLVSFIGRRQLLKTWTFYVLSCLLLMLLYAVCRTRTGDILTCICRTWGVWDLDTFGGMCVWAGESTYQP